MNSSLVFVMLITNVFHFPASSNYFPDTLSQLGVLLDITVEKKMADDSTLSVWDKDQILG